MSEQKFALITGYEDLEAQNIRILIDKKIRCGAGGIGSALAREFHDKGII